MKSLWEKYASEIGTQNGPLRYEEDASQCTHLNGFVPLDMESWWAERSISCMINDKSRRANDNANESNSKNLTTANSNPITTTNTITTQKSAISPILASLDSELSLIDSNNNERKLASINSLNKSISYKLATAKPITPAALHHYNNFQLCFS